MRALMFVLSCRRFCQMVHVRRLGAASGAFVSRLGCLGAGAAADTQRLLGALVHTIEDVCRDGGSAAARFLADARQCRWANFHP